MIPKKPFFALFSLSNLASGLLIFILIVSFTIKQSTPEPFKLSYPAYFGGRFSIPSDNPLTVEGVQLGRMLFYENRLSKGSQISCASCHRQELAFTDGKAHSIGVNGGKTTRNTMSLTNLLWVRNFFWDGRSASLEAQAIFPLTHPDEMGQSLKVSVEKLKADPNYTKAFLKAFGTEEINPDRIVKALAQFERILISADAPFDRYLKGEQQLTKLETEGMNLFFNAPDPLQGVRGANCGHCHGSPKLFKELFHNNGLDVNPIDPGRKVVTGQESDLGRFRVPTLRNIAVTAPYMHDGRFATLEEVLNHYNDHIQVSVSLSPFLKNISNEPNGKTLNLKPEEKKAIIAFLNTLTDSTFLTRSDFANPHLNLSKP